MKIGIIGAGFTGLSAAHTLLELGHEATIFEKDSSPGGLAIGFKKEAWDWTLEAHYHHWFTNDTAVLNLAKKTNYEVLIKRPHTNWYVQGKIYPFDSVTSALTFPLLSIIDRLRNLLTLGFLRVDPLWRPLEKIKAESFLSFTMGKKVYEMLWKPLFLNKFGSYSNTISLAWFWARIKKRTQSLAYPKGGFLSFANHLTASIKKLSGTVYFDAEIIEIRDDKKPYVLLQVKNGNRKYEFDYIIVTLPSFAFLKLAPQLPEEYAKKLSLFKGLGATNLILRLRQPFFNDNTYWLSIADSSSPIMAIVEHTNFMDKKYYANEHIVYLGKYLEQLSPYFNMDKEELLTVYDPFLKKINPQYKKNLIGYDLFKAGFAQPIIPTNYSHVIPPFETPLPHVFLANIQQVYPWDRGTNYAVELGQKIAEVIEKKNNASS